MTRRGGNDAEVGCSSNAVVVGMPLPWIPASAGMEAVGGLASLDVRGYFFCYCFQVVHVVVDGVQEEVVGAGVD